MAADDKKTMQDAMEAREAQITDLQNQVVELRKAMKEAPSATEVLARPSVYEAWLKKAQEALNG